MKSKNKKILYYIDSPFPTKAQVALAEEHGASFRNARMVKDDTKPEPCDAVAGCYPKSYEKLEDVKKIDTSKIDSPDADSDGGKDAGRPVSNTGKGEKLPEASSAEKTAKADGVKKTPAK